METNKFLLYGANGYTGRLIARYASDYGLQPVLAGRNRAALERLAGELGYEYIVSDLSKAEDVTAMLQKFKVVVHAAGPFDQTTEPMVEACIATGTHYIDINGDSEVFEHLQVYDQACKDAGIMILPGAGFDVVPTDCMSALLKEQLPDANKLTIGFATRGGGISRGTATTMVMNLGRGGARRQAGRLIRVPLGEHKMIADFGTHRAFMMSIPWGDISTAYYSTGIPNIETFTGVPKLAYYFLKFQSFFNPLLRTDAVKKWLLKKIEHRPAGPSDEQRKNAITHVLASVSNGSGRTRKMILTCPEGYTFTTYSCLLIVQKILSGNFKPGYQTPSTAYGHRLVNEISGVRMSELT